MWKLLSVKQSDKLITIQSRNGANTSRNSSTLNKRLENPVGFENRIQHSRFNRGTESALTEIDEVRGLICYQNRKSCNTRIITALINRLGDADLLRRKFIRRVYCDLCPASFFLGFIPYLDLFSAPLHPSPPLTPLPFYASPPIIPLLLYPVPCNPSPPL